MIGIRAARDKRLKLSDIKVLMALGYHANRAGVCWPSIATLEAESGVHEATVIRSLNLLIELGFVRRLTPGMFKQKRGVWGFSNRYQILWAGNEEVPEYEEVLSAGALQHPDDRLQDEETHTQGSQRENHIATQLIAAYRKGYAQATGTPAPPVPAAPALQMADAKVKPAWFQAYVALSISIAGRANTQLPSFQSLAAEAIAHLQTANARSGFTSDG